MQEATDGSASPISSLLRDIGLSRSKPAILDDTTGELLRVASDPLLLSRLLKGSNGDERASPAVNMPELYVINDARQRFFPVDGLSPLAPNSGEDDVTSLHPEVFVPTDHDMAAAVSTTPVQKANDTRNRSLQCLVGLGALLLLLVLGVILS